MYEKSFNIPDFNSKVDTEIKGLNAEQKKLDEKIARLNWVKECVASIQKKLNEAYQTINTQERDLDLLEQQLAEEMQQRKERARIEAKLVDVTKENAGLAVQLTTQRELCETISRQLAEEKKQREELEMKLAEMGKLSAGMAKKSSEEAMLKALRTYANTSKRKTIDKRAFAKQAILELANVNGLTLPDDLAAIIESLDDEQADPKVVVNGDIVRNKHVENEVDNVSSGGIGIKSY